MVVSGCGNGAGGTAVAALTTPTDLPARTAITADKATVPFGTWGVVKAVITGGTTDRTDVFAIKVTAVIKGRPGDKKGMQSANGPLGVNVATAVPYYVSYSYATLAGTSYETPTQDVYVDDGTPDGFVTIMIGSPGEHCRPAADVNLSQSFGEAHSGCAVALTDKSNPPTALIYTYLHGSQDVRFSLPAPSGP